MSNKFYLRVVYMDNIVGSKGTHFGVPTVLYKGPMQSMAASSMLMTYVKSAMDLGGIVINEDGYTAFIPFSEIKKIEAMTEDEKIERYGKGK